MKRLCMVVFVFLVCAPLASAQTSEMSIKINENVPVHIKITIENPSNIAELRNIINEPRIHDIYREQLGKVFDEVVNLELFIDSGVFVVEFDSLIVKESNGGWVIERMEFIDNLDAMSTLKISLPQGTTFVNSNPPPERVSENVLEWNDVDFIPHVRYRKQAALPRKGMVAAIIVLFVLVTGGYFKWKKRK